MSFMNKTRLSLAPTYSLYDHIPIFKDMNFGAIYSPKYTALDLYLVTYPGAAVDWQDKLCSLHLRPAPVFLDCHGQCPEMDNGQCTVRQWEDLVTYKFMGHGSDNLKILLINNKVHFD